MQFVYVRGQQELNLPKVIAPTYFSLSKSTEGPRERLKFNLTNNMFYTGKFARNP